jgi:hypothetical protein
MPLCLWLKAGAGHSQQKVPHDQVIRANPFHWPPMAAALLIGAASRRHWVPVRQALPPAAFAINAHRRPDTTG